MPPMPMPNKMMNPAMSGMAQQQGMPQQPNIMQLIQEALSGPQAGPTPVLKAQPAPLTTGSPVDKFAGQAYTPAVMPQVQTAVPPTGGPAAAPVGRPGIANIFTNLSNKLSGMATDAAGRPPLGRDMMQAPRPTPPATVNPYSGGFGNGMGGPDSVGNRSPAMRQGWGRRTNPVRNTGATGFTGFGMEKRMPTQ